MYLSNPLLKAIWEQSRAWLLGILLIILISISLFIYQSQFVSPATGKLLEQKTQLQKDLRDRQAELAESEVPVSAVEQMEHDLQLFSELIPIKQKFADFIGELFYLADQSMLEIREVSYQPEVDEETSYLHYGLSFSVTGTYDQVKKFILLLENTQRILIIDKISLSGRRDKGSDSQVSLEINLTTLFREDAP